MRVQRDDRGQVLPLVALVLVFAVMVATGIAHLAVEATERARAEHAADAAALAGAVGDRPAAATLARANGAELESFARDGDIVVVAVRRHGHRATARAEAVVTIPYTRS